MKKKETERKQSTRNDATRAVPPYAKARLPIFERYGMIGTFGDTTFFSR